MNPIEVIGGASSGAASGAAAGTAIAPGIGTIIGAGIGAVGSYLGGSSAQSRQVKLWEMQAIHERKMLNTAHRREVADLRAAGLNPVLSATGGPGAGSGSGGSVPQVPDIVSPAISTALNVRRLAKELESQVVTNDNVRENTKLQKVQALKSEQERDNLRTYGKILKEDLQSAQASAAQARNMEKIDESFLGPALRWIERISNAVRGTGSAAGVVRRGLGGQ